MTGRYKEGESERERDGYFIELENHVPVPSEKYLNYSSFVFVCVVVVVAMCLKWVVVAKKGDSQLLFLLLHNKSCFKAVCRR